MSAIIHPNTLIISKDHSLVKNFLDMFLAIQLVLKCNVQLKKVEKAGAH